VCQHIQFLWWPTSESITLIFVLIFQWPPGISAVAPETDTHGLACADKSYCPADPPELPQNSSQCCQVFPGLQPCEDRGYELKRGSPNVGAVEPSLQTWPPSLHSFGLNFYDGFGRTGIEPDRPEERRFERDIDRRCPYCCNFHLKPPFANKKAGTKARPLSISSVPARRPSFYSTFSGNGRF